MHSSQQFITILIVIMATAITRYLPFLVFPTNKKTPDYIQYLGKTLPYASIGLLVVYCLKDVSFVSAPFGICEILSILCIILLHVWKRNVLLSIGAGSILYMILLQWF